MVDDPKTPPEQTPPPQPETPVQKSEPAARNQPVENLATKATLLLLFTLALVLGTSAYLLMARGFFEPKQNLVLVADNAEGVVAGMDLTFAGFPIGTVRDFALGKDGNVRIRVDVLRREAHWLRTSSVFTLVKGLLGAPQLRAYSGVLTDPPLPDGAERPVLRGDANEQISQVIGAARDVLDNLNQITSAGSPLNQSMNNLQVFTRKLQSSRGALHAVLGNEADAQKLVLAIERANAVMGRAEQLMGSADRLVGSTDRLVRNADTEVFGPQGLSREARAAIRELHTGLAEARASLRRVDAILVEAQGIGANVRAATADLGGLRADVEANLRKIEDLINDLNRKWPFAKDREIQLP